MPLNGNFTNLPPRSNSFNVRINTSWTYSGPLSISRAPLPRESSYFSFNSAASPDGPPSRISFLTEPQLHLTNFTLAFRFSLFSNKSRLFPVEYVLLDIPGLIYPTIGDAKLECQFISVRFRGLFRHLVVTLHSQYSAKGGPFRDPRPPNPHDISLVFDEVQADYQDDQFHTIGLSLDFHRNSSSTDGILRAHLLHPSGNIERHNASIAKWTSFHHNGLAAEEVFSRINDLGQSAKLYFGAPGVGSVGTDSSVQWLPALMNLSAVVVYGAPSTSAELDDVVQTVSGFVWTATDADRAAIISRAAGERPRSSADSVSMTTAMVAGVVAGAGGLALLLGVLCLVFIARRLRSKKRIQNSPAASPNRSTSTDIVNVPDLERAVCIGEGYFAKVYVVFWQVRVKFVFLVFAPQAPSQLRTSLHAFSPTFSFPLLLF